MNVQLRLINIMMVNVDTRVYTFLDVETHQKYIYEMPYDPAFQKGKIYNVTFN